MSNATFLPFIKNTSSAEAVFKAILKRTKGSSNSALSNLLSVVLMLGVEEVRAKIDRMDDNLTTSAKVADLVAQEIQHHIPQAEREFWEFASKHMNLKVKGLDSAELEIFFTVLATHKPQELETSGCGIAPYTYERLVSHAKEDYNTDIDEVPGVKICEDHGVRVGFTCWEEFKAYLAIKASDENITEVCPVYIKTAADPVTAHIYSENHCSSPYAGKNDET